MATFIDLITPIFLAFREGLEATLVVVIILVYLKKTNQRKYNRYVYIGAILAILSSILFAIIFSITFGGFSGILEELFEGITFIISGIFIVTLVLWVSKEGPKMRAHLEEKVEQSIETQKIFSISILTFVIIIREGIELVLLLTGTTSIGSITQASSIIGATIGLGIAIVIGILTFYGIRTIDLTKFFKITNLMLILFAAGLITFGIHELIEAGVVNPIIGEVWNIKHILPESFPDGNPATPEWLEIIGSLLKALFGYNANPSLLEIIIYPSLLISIGIISLKLWKRTNAIVIMEVEKEIQTKLSID
ncbi:MAG: FTR1 family protein [Promethearchaeota archaeon]|nr:MAG: FTR1 family protein [Candidatus Lokiarchaeota archaeon]